MSYTAVVYKTLIDSRPIGSEVIIQDYTTLPTPAVVGTYSYRIIELPLNVITPPSATQAVYVQAVDPITHIPTGEVFTAVTAPTLPLAGQFQIDPVATFTLGTILFNSLDGGITVQITVTGRGSLVFAADINNPCDELTEARGTYASVGDRLDALVSSVNIQRVDYVVGTPNGTYSGSTTLFNLPWSYLIGSGQLFSYYNGNLGTVGFDYSETSTTSVTYSSPLIIGQRVSFVNFT